MGEKVENKKVFVQIVKQPSLRDRFRYETEFRAVGHSQDVRKSQKTFPAIRVLNYTGMVTVVVSCVTTEYPYRPHPNVLVGKYCCKGVCKTAFDTDEMDPTVYTFNNMNIQCTKKEVIQKALAERETYNVDPFRTGFDHKHKDFQPALRLCFQAFLTSAKNKVKPIQPVVSEIIRSQRTKIDFEICDISDTMSPTTGTKKIIIFCGKVEKGDIKIRFYREGANRTVEWEAWVDKPRIHKQAAISFNVPAYATDHISEPVDVFLELVRPSDGTRSEPPQPFQYFPVSPTVDTVIRKKEQNIIQTKELCQYVQQWKDEQRNRSKMCINPNIPLINPNIPPGNSSQRSNERANARPPATQSNFIPNLSRHSQPAINHAAQSMPQQQTYCDNRALSHNHIQHSARRVNKYEVQSHHGVQLSQPFNSHPQPNQFQFQSGDSNAINPSYSQLRPHNIGSERQPINYNYRVQSSDGGTFHPAQYSRQQPELNSCLQQQNEHFRQPTFNPVEPTPVAYGRKYLLGAKPGCPFPNSFNAEQMHNPTTSNGHQFAPRNDATMSVNNIEHVNNNNIHLLSL